MRTLYKAAFAGVALSIFGVAQMSAASASEGVYTVVNTNEAVSILQVYIANANGPEPWRPASMDEAIAPGAQEKFTASGSGCVYDIKVRFSDGDEQTFSNVNICNGDRVIAT